jgi:hypothetical protein
LTRPAVQMRSVLVLLNTCDKCGWRQTVPYVPLFTQQDLDEYGQRCYEAGSRDARVTEVHETYSALALRGPLLLGSK